MRLPVACLLALSLAAAEAAEWRIAEPGWRYEFPRDHGNHPDFKTEWWYFTGNLRAQDGREFGFQLTFFRQGIDRSEDIIPMSRFVTRDVKFAHFTVSDLAARKFHFFQKTSRGAYGEAGFDNRNRLAWIENWECDSTPEGFTLKASQGGVEVDLALRSPKKAVIHGADGVSRKGAEPGQASHYYSFTRLETSGSVKLDGVEIPVTGTSWFDHEWATNQLGKNQVGWDWFSLQFEDGSELMLFQLRTKDGGRDEHSAGTLVDASGRQTPLGSGDFSLEPMQAWKSPTGAAYPVAWRLKVPSLALDVEVHAAMEDQELRLQPIVYWEGAVRASGTREGKPVAAKGYLEMTGYAGPVRGMQ